MADCPECGGRRGNHLKGCPKMTPAQKEGAGKKSEAMKGHHKDPAFRKRRSEGMVANWKRKRYREQISKARKQQHAEGRCWCGKIHGKGGE